jgi:hypothetical protein
MAVPIGAQTPRRLTSSGSSRRSGAMMLRNMRTHLSIVPRMISRTRPGAFWTFRVGPLFPASFLEQVLASVLRQWSHRATSAQTKPASRMQEAVAATRSTDRVAALLMFDVIEIT